MISQTTLQNLINLANASYQQHLNVTEFALRAAILVAAESASHSDAKSFNAAAFVASTSFINLAGLSAQLLANAINNQTLLGHSFTRSEDRADLNGAAFTKLSIKIKNTSLTNEAYNLYHQTFDTIYSEPQRLALQAARTHFKASFAMAYTAYLQGLAVAARYNSMQRDRQFDKAVTTQLTKSFLCEPVAPDFFMAIMTSDFTKKLATVLLFASLLILMVSSLAMMNPVFGAAMVSTIGLSENCVAGVGVASLVSGTSLFAARFFTQQRYDSDNKKSEKEVKEAIDVEGQVQLDADPLAF